MALSRPAHIALEGNISSGKTTLMQNLEKAAEHWGQSQNIEFFREPLETWCNFGPEKRNMLDLMYKEGKTYSFGFQTVALMSKIDQLHFSKSINIVERSTEAQARVFIPLLYEDKKITACDREILEYSLNILSKLPEQKIDLIIHLYTSPETAMQRLEQRSRLEEEKVKIEYLARIHKKYEQWLENPVVDLPYPVWTLNGNKPISAPLLLNQIVEYVSELRA